MFTINNLIQKANYINEMNYKCFHLTKILSVVKNHCFQLRYRKRIDRIWSKTFHIPERNE